MTGFRSALRGEPVVAALFVVLWSSGFIGAGLGTAVSSAVTILMWRFIAVAAVLLLLQFVVKRHRMSRGEVAVQVLLGLFSQSIYLFSMFGAVQLGVTSGIVSLIDALQPVCASALAGLLLSERASGRQWWGLSVGLVGVAVVISGDLGLRPAVPAWAYLIPFIGMVALTVATLIERKVEPRAPLMDSLAVQCAASAGFFTLVGLGTGQAAMPTAGQAWLAIAWLIALSTLGGYGLYWIILKSRGVTYVSSLIYLTAPATLIWGFFMFGDAISFVSGIGIAVCLGGVVLVHSERNRRGGVVELPLVEPARSDGGESRRTRT
ncbi:DMT family transporter [Streptomyces acidiscabies]|uniref:DMT family transporter n=1 Tax=Streptomyces acidiscabies TaxID=42234 RepID=UPI0009533241|nr:DMT family transporter [Streptomyces acidiscabies]